MEFRESADDERKGAGEGREHEDEDQGEDVDRDIVVAILGSRATRRSLAIILSPLKFGAEEGNGDIFPSCCYCRRILLACG